MKRLLLLGAGFTRNWGGWLGNEVFEYLLGDPEIIADPDLRLKLWAEKNKVEGGGFEAALDKVQREAKATGDTKQLNRFERAVTRMFDAMDQAFSNAYPNGPFRFEFCASNAKRPVAEFLTRFDAIFTLNQDLLLERHYFEHMPYDSRWQGFQVPGMKVASDVIGQQGAGLEKLCPGRKTVEI